MCVRACHTLTHMLITERGWKRKTFPPKKKSHNLCYHWIEKSVISCVRIMHLNLETIFPCVTFLALLLIYQIPRRQTEKEMEIETLSSSLGFSRD